LKKERLREPQQSASSLAPKISEAIPSDSVSYTSRAFFVSPLDPRLLTQPIRLSRARPQLAEPETTRAAVTKIHTTWEAYRLLASLTVANFRNYLAEDFQRLPLPEIDWKQFLVPFKSVVEDSSFWRLVEGADIIQRNYERRRDGLVDDESTIWNGKYLNTRFTAEQHPYSSEKNATRPRCVGCYCDAAGHRTSASQPTVSPTLVSLETGKELGAPSRRTGKASCTAGS
jgi:hypothetical protein